MLKRASDWLFGLSSKLEDYASRMEEVRHD